jgi:Lon protease-like protein
MAVTGCAARVTGVLEEFDDGRSNIVVRGGERFRVLEVLGSEDPQDEALRAQVVYVADDSVQAPAELLREVEQLFARAVELMETEVAEEVPEGIPRSYAIAGILDLELPTKQRLLQLLDEGARLGLVVEYLRGLVPRLEVWRSRKDAIKGNGKAT